MSLRKKKKGESAQSADWLDAGEEQRLARRAQDDHDIEARNRLVQSHLPLVRRQAASLSRRGAPFNDLVQEGCLGLLRAAQLFDRGRNVRFSTYAAHWSRAYMQRYLSRALAARYAVPPYVICATKGQRARARPRQILPVLSLDDSEASRPDLPLSERISDGDRTPEEQVAELHGQGVALATLGAVLRSMNDPRAWVLVADRLLTSDPATLSAVGEKIDLSREGVRLLEKRIIEQVREVLCSAA